MKCGYFAAGVTLMTLFCYIFKNALQVLFVCISGETQSLKKPHHVVFYLQTFCESVSSRCGTLERTSLHIATTPFHCRLFPILVPACEWGLVCFTSDWKTLCLCVYSTLSITLNLCSLMHLCFVRVTGYSGLVLDSTRSNVFCNCTDDSIYMFNVSGVKTTPGKRWSHSELEKKREAVKFILLHVNRLGCRIMFWTTCF